jgi:hypothetical protein
VQRFQRQRFQGQQVQCPTQKIGSLFTHGVLLSEYDSSAQNVSRNFTQALGV